MGLVIYGAGGHGQDIAHDILDFCYFRDDAQPLAWTGWVRKHAAFLKECDWLAGINDPWQRAALVQKHRELRWRDDGRWIHRSAQVTACDIGEHTHINANVFATRTRFGQFCTVSPGATICGDVNIGDFVQIGANATIRNLLTIGDGAVIGCGAVVVDNVPAGMTVVGNPARELRTA